MKKLLTFLMTFVMVVSLLPATAFAANNTATTMRLAKTQGTVTVTNVTGKKISQTSNMKLYNGYKVKTGAKSYAWISLDDTKVAKLDANSVMEVQKQGKSLTLYLSSGNVFFNVKDPLKKDETFHIKTSTMTTGIRGTSGCVRVINERVTEIHLMTGRLQILTENPEIHVTKTATLTAGQKAFSLIAEEAVAATGEQADIIIEQLEHEEICGVCSKEIANDPALLERIEREAPHLLPEKAAAEADERLAADEAKTEEKQAAIEGAVAEQTFPEDVDPYFEKKEGGGGAAASTVVNVATWADLLKAIQDYNAGSGTTQINLTATIDARNEQQTLPPIGNKGALTLNLGKNKLYLNGTLYNEGDLTITNVDGYIYGNGRVPAVQNDNILTLLDGQIDGAGRTSVVNNAGTFYMRGGELVATAPMGNMQPLALDNMNGARAYLYGGTVWSGAENTTGAVGVHNRGHLTISGATLRNLNECVANLGAVSMTSGLIESSGRGVDNQGNFRITGGKIAVAGQSAIGIRMITNDPNVTTTVMDDAVITAAGGYGIYAGQGAEGVLDVSGGTVSGENADTIAIQIDSAAVYVSIDAAALVRAKGEETVFQYAADGQWPVDASIIYDTENSGYWRLLLHQGGNPSALQQFVAQIQAFKGTSAARITLTDDVVVDTAGLRELGLAELRISATGTSSLTIDLAGHDLILDVPLINGAVTGITDSVGTGVISTTTSSTAQNMIQNTATLSLQNVAVNVTDTANRAYGIVNSGSLQINDGTNIEVYKGSGVRSTGGTVIMNGGEITVAAGTGIQAAAGSLNLVGGGISATSNTPNTPAAAVEVAETVNASSTIGTILKAHTAQGTAAVYNSTLPAGYTIVANCNYYTLQKITTVSSAAAFVSAVNSYTGDAPQVLDLTGDITITPALVQEVLALEEVPETLLFAPAGGEQLTVEMNENMITLDIPLESRGALRMMSTGIYSDIQGSAETLIINKSTLSVERTRVSVTEGTGIRNIGGTVKTSESFMNAQSPNTYGLYSDGGTVYVEKGGIYALAANTVGLYATGGTDLTVTGKNGGAVNIEVNGTGETGIGIYSDSEANNVTLKEYCKFFVESGIGYKDTAGLTTAEGPFVYVEQTASAAAGDIIGMEIGGKLIMNESTEVTVYKEGTAEGEIIGVVLSGELQMNGRDIAASDASTALLIKSTGKAYLNSGKIYAVDDAGYAIRMEDGAALNTDSIGTTVMAKNPDHVVAPSLPDGFTAADNGNGFFELQKAMTITNGQELVTALAAFDGKTATTLTLAPSGNASGISVSDEVVAAAAEAAGKDLTFTLNSSGSQPLTIDLNGAHLGLYTPLIAKQGDLVIVDSAQELGLAGSVTASAEVGIDLQGGSTLTMESLDMTAAANCTGIRVGENATLTVNDGYYGVNSTVTMIVNNGYTVLEGGTFAANNTTPAGLAIQNNGDLTMKGGSITTSAHPAISCTSGSTFTMEAGTISTYGYIGAGVELMSGAEATLKGGTIKVTSAGGGEKGVSVASGAVLTLDGAAITVKGDSEASHKNYGIYDNGGTVNILSGSITADVGATGAGTGEGNTYALYSTANWNGGLTIAPHAELDRPAALIRVNTEKLAQFMNPVVEGYTTAEEVENDAVTGYWYLCYPN